MYATSGSIEIDGRTWDYFPVTLNRMGEPGGPVPVSYYVSFVDPDDRELRVEARGVSVDKADLTEDGLRRIFMRAKFRQWKSRDGTLWEISFHPGVAVGARRQTGDAEVQARPSLLVFEPAEGPNVSYYLQWDGIESVGLLGDAELQEFLKKAKANTPGDRR